MPCIQFVKGPLKDRQAVLSEDDVTIGRHAGCDLVVPDPKVSSKHAVIRSQNDQWWIYDLNSSNGLYVDEEEIDATILEEGNRVTIGESVFVFKLDGEEEGEDIAEFSAVAPERAAHDSAQSAGTAAGGGHAEKTGEIIASQPGTEEPASGMPAGGAGVGIGVGPEDVQEEEAARGKEPAAPPPESVAAPEESDLKDDDIEIISELNEAYNRMTEQLGRVIVGQKEVIEQVLVSILCRGHSLLIGVPGLAKTLLVSTLSQVLDLSFSRIQFTPDLMPSDITGTDVLEEDQSTGRRNFRFVQGPLFANMILADEINRTPPKTQAALLEAMQEHLVTVGERSYHLPEPFFVLATQNPIEQEGTYPLPEAQLDRFMFNIIVDYPSAEEEHQIIQQVTGTYKAELEVALGAQDVLRLQQVVRRVPAADHVIELARNLARATRPGEPEAPEFVREMVAWGAGPRAGIYLIFAAKAFAILQGRCHATTSDVIKATLPVLRHRVLTTFNAEAAGVSSDDVIRQLVEQVGTEPTIDV